jgi:hypothetical protein
MPLISSVQYVEAVLESEVTVTCRASDLVQQLLNLGASKTATGVSLRYDSQQELASLFTALQQLGVPFSEGPGWPPSDVFQHLREQGLVSGRIKSVSWRRPNEPVVREA